MIQFELKSGLVKAMFDGNNRHKLITEKGSTNQIVIPKLS